MLLTTLSSRWAMASAAARFLLKLPRGFHKGTHGSQAEEARARSGGVWFGFAVFAPPLKRMVPSRICSLCWVVSRARYLVTYVAGTCRDPVRTETEPRTLGGSFAQQLSLSFRSECPCTGRRDGIQCLTSDTVGIELKNQGLWVHRLHRVATF